MSDFCRAGFLSRISTSVQVQLECAIDSLVTQRIYFSLLGYSIFVIQSVRLNDHDFLLPILPYPSSSLPTAQSKLKTNVSVIFNALNVVSNFLKNTPKFLLMAALLSCHYSTSGRTIPTISTKPVHFFNHHHHINRSKRIHQFSPQCSLRSSTSRSSFPLKECAISIALAIGLVTAVPDWTATATPIGPAIPNLSVLISGPPIKDPEALLRYALPIDNKAIREVQKPLEDITESLKVSGTKALDSAERVRKNLVLFSNVFCE